MGNFVDLMTGTVLVLLHSHLLFCLLIFCSWVKFISPPDGPLVHPHVCGQPHHGPPRVAVDPPPWSFMVKSSFIMSREALRRLCCFLARDGSPWLLATIPLTAIFASKSLFLKTAMVAGFAGMPCTEMTRACSRYLSRIQPVITAEGGIIKLTIFFYFSVINLWIMLKFLFFNVYTVIFMGKNYKVTLLYSIIF